VINKQEQSGLALLLFMVVMIGFIIAGFSGLLTSAVEQQSEKKRIENLKVLLEAKESLLSYSVNYAISGDLVEMGKLPCPDVTDTVFPSDIEGNQDNPCGARGVNSIGYFPFRTLGSGKTEDSSNECLWYVVSGDYKNQAQSNLLNWDTVGYLNMVDENGSLSHASSEDEFPIAFIISPGATISQDRTPDVALPKCRSNYTATSYLEGGPNIDYGTELPATADTLWEILTTSAAANQEDVDYNDQVVAIYKNELWDRVRQVNDLAFNNTSAALPTSKIELLTKTLAECLAAYGNANLAGRLLPYHAPLDLDPANLDLDEYGANSNYDDDITRRYGRFPQLLDNSVINTANFILDTAGLSYCENLIPATVTDYDELFWKNWKDHFFYIVSEDFDSSSPTLSDATKCDTGAGGLSCISIDTKADKIAAIVIFSGEKIVGQNRVWWWDDVSSTVVVDDKGATISNYLEGDLATVDHTGSQNFTMTTTDYVYCVEYNNPSLTAIKCSDLNNAF